MTMPPAVHVTTQDEVPKQSFEPAESKDDYSEAQSKKKTKESIPALKPKTQNEVPKQSIEPAESKVDNSEAQRKNKTKESIGVVLLSCFVAALGSYVFGSCMGYSAPVQAAIRNDLDVSLEEFSVFGSLITVGSMIGAITSRHIADFMGRKGAMRLSAVISSIGWIAIYLAKGAVLLVAGRLLSGCGIGIFSYVVPMYIAEIEPRDLRGGLATLNQLFIVIGASVSFLLGISKTWRYLALTGIISCLVQLVGLLLIPESPVKVQVLMMKMKSKIIVPAEIALKRLINGS